jgi:hypothetical protein
MREKRAPGARGPGCDNNEKQCSTSLSFERIETRLTRPANSGRASLIRAATHRWRMSG